MNKPPPYSAISFPPSTTIPLSPLGRAKQPVPPKHNPLSRVSQNPYPTSLDSSSSFLPLPVSQQASPASSPSLPWALLWAHSVPLPASPSPSSPPRLQPASPSSPSAPLFPSSLSSPSFPLAWPQRSSVFPLTFSHPSPARVLRWPCAYCRGIWPESGLEPVRLRALGRPSRRRFLWCRWCHRQRPSLPR